MGTVWPVNEDDAVAMMERLRWGPAPRCPDCQSENVAKITGRDQRHAPRYLWRCRSCPRQFTVRVGTMFEGSKVALSDWCFVFWAACLLPRGVTAQQIHAVTGVSYKSALSMMHRIRRVLRVRGPSVKLLGDWSEA